MPPEVLDREDYTGYNHDLWTLGIILFMMATGSHPFGVGRYGKANKNAEPYKYLALNRADLFWNVHKALLLKFPLSQQLKDLIVSMF